MGNLLARKYTTKLGMTSSSPGSVSLGARQRWPIGAAACQGAGRELLSHNLLSSGQAFAFRSSNAMSWFRNKREMRAKHISLAAPLPSASLPRGDILGSGLTPWPLAGKLLALPVSLFTLLDGSIFPCCIQESITNSEPQLNQRQAPGSFHRLPFLPQVLCGADN